MELVDGDGVFGVVEEVGEGGERVGFVFVLEEVEDGFEGAGCVDVVDEVDGVVFVVGADLVEGDFAVFGGLGAHASAAVEVKVDEVGVGEVAPDPGGGLAGESDGWRLVVFEGAVGGGNAEEDGVPG